MRESTRKQWPEIVKAEQRRAREAEAARKADEKRRAAERKAGIGTIKRIIGESAEQQQAAPSNLADLIMSRPRLRKALEHAPQAMALLTSIYSRHKGERVIADMCEEAEYRAEEAEMQRQDEDAEDGVVHPPPTPRELAQKRYHRAVGNLAERRDAMLDQPRLAAKSDLDFAIDSDPALRQLFPPGSAKRREVRQVFAVAHLPGPEHKALTREDVAAWVEQNPLTSPRNTDEDEPIEPLPSEIAADAEFEARFAGKWRGGVDDDQPSGDAEKTEGA